MKWKICFLAVTGIVMILYSQFRDNSYKKEIRELKQLNRKAALRLRRLRLSLWVRLRIMIHQNRFIQ